MRALALGVMALLAPRLASATLLDSVNFTEATFATVGASATGMAWAPDGSNRLFVTMKDGRLLVVKNGTVLATPFSADAVATNGECGLLSLAFDPNFSVNGYVYVFETLTFSEQQIVRYTALGDVGTARTVLVRNLPTTGTIHNGGGLGIGPDGKLYWAVGDLSNGTGVNDDLTSLAAKIGRANRDGTLPSDNPFADGAGPNNDYIWARGYKSPFSMVFQPGTGALWMDVAGQSYEQIFIVPAGSHAGFNLYENNQPAGFLRPVIAYRTNSLEARSLTGTGAVRSGGVATFTTTVEHGFHQGTKLTISNVADPSFNGAGFIASVPTPSTFTFAQAGANASSGSGTALMEQIGGAVTGGDFWSSSAVPAAYRGNFFFGDFNTHRIERVTLRADNSVATFDHFATGINQSVDVAAGPDGALYSLTLGGTIRRISYNAPAQGLVVSPLHVRLDEGGRGVVNVRLATAPLGNVVVGASLAGDADITLANGGALTFTSANWSTPQALRVQAASDGDASEDQATLTLSSSGLTSESVGVKVTELAGTASGPATPAPAGDRAWLAALAAALLGLGALQLRSGARAAR